MNIHKIYYLSKNKKTIFEMTYDMDKVPIVAFG